MEALTEPLDRLRKALRWFVAVREMRMLHVFVGPELRIAALQQIDASQASPHNKSPFVFTEISAETGGADWIERAREVNEDMTEVRERAASAKPPLILRAPSPPPPASSGLSHFVSTVRGHVEGLSPPLEGLVVVLAPAAVVKVDTWLSDLRAIFREPALARVRWIVVEPEPAPARAIADELGGVAEKVDVRVSPAATQKMLSAMLSGMKTAPLDADGARLSGMAGPREPPPPRPGRRAPSPGAAGAELSAAGAAPALADPAVIQPIRIELLSSALAQQSGRPEDATRHQTEARNLAVKAGLVREAIVLDLMLGAELVQASAYAQARRVFEGAIERARAAKAADLESQGHIAKGGTLLAEQRPLEAARAYADGAKVAESLPSRALAIECYRMVGQVLFGAGQHAEAATALHRAVEIASGAPKHERALSSGPAAARKLADIYRRQGLREHAESLEAQADRWEKDGAAPPAEPTGGAERSSSPSGPNGRGEG